MKVQLAKGKYVAAVSGGVDSVTLLNMLSKQKGLDLIVAHYDHGIRKDSSNDKRFVQQLAQDYGLPFEYAEGHLGSQASEATAREARYKFLREVKNKHQAQAIITAHHQDDALETAIINLLRGTGRKGLTSLESKDDIVRPLLGFSKQELLNYAKANSLIWHEDSTNTDVKYLRNYVRHNIIAKLEPAKRKQLLAIIQSQHSVNVQLDELLLSQLGSEKELERKKFAALPHNVAGEVMAAWLRANGLREFDRPTIERAVIGAKTAKVSKRVAIKKDVFIEVGANNLALSSKPAVGFRKTNSN